MKIQTAHRQLKSALPHSSSGRIYYGDSFKNRPKIPPSTISIARKLIHSKEEGTKAPDKPFGNSRITKLGGLDRRFPSSTKPTSQVYSYYKGSSFKQVAENHRSSSIENASDRPLWRKELSKEIPVAAYNLESSFGAETVLLRSRSTVFRQDYG